MGVSKRRRFQPRFKPQFFQPLLPDFLSNFSIPKSFNKHLEKEEVMKSGNKIVAILRDHRRTERVWYVTITGDYRQQQQLKLEDGWENFCKDFDLHVGDFLVFRHQGDLIFDVFAFDPTACERELPKFDDFGATPRLIQYGKGLKEKMMGDQEHPESKVAFKPTGFPYFNAVLKPYHAKSSEMLIPQWFARENGLWRRKCPMVLIDEKGRSWSMILGHRKYSHNPFIGGWSRFHKANGLKSGDPVVFELINSARRPVMKFYSCEGEFPVSDPAITVVEV